MEDISYNGSARKLFGRQRSIHDVLGGGKVGEVLLWRDKRVSGAILIGSAAVWFLVEVVDYNFVTLMCHVAITTMLLLFIWSSAAEFFNWNPPNMVCEDLDWSRDAASTFQRIINGHLSTIATGYHPKPFLLTILSLWIISIIGSFIGGLNLLFFGIVWLGTIPFLYEQYEDEVDNLAYQVQRRVNKMYHKFQAEVLGRIPRCHLKDKR